MSAFMEDFYQRKKRGEIVNLTSVNDKGTLSSDKLTIILGLLTDLRGRSDLSLLTFAFALTGDRM